MKGWILYFLLVAGCGQGSEARGRKRLDMGAFVIEVPKSWRAVPQHGGQGAGGRIAIDAQDTLQFDLGFESATMQAFDPMLLDSARIPDLDPELVDTSEVAFVRNRMQADLDHIRRSHVIWDSLEGRLVRIVWPRKPGKGTTGIFIDSLWVSESGIDRFQLYAVGLKPENEKKVLQALRTLRFKKR